MLSRESHLRKKKDFEKVFKAGKTVRGELLVLKFKENGSSVTKVGISVSKKVSPKATVRNKIRRRLAAAFRKIMFSKTKGLDMVLIVVPGLEEKNFHQIKEVLENIFRKAKLI